MCTSDDCVDFIKQVEGFSAQPYFDYSQYTVGYGTKCPTEKFFDYKANGIPKKEAEALLREELVSIEETINKKFIDVYGLTLTQHQFDALVSFSFNIGTGWVISDSTLKNAILEDVNDNDMVYAFGLYCTAGGKYLPGLVTRRLCEANMFLNGVYSKNITDDFGYVYYDANGGTVTYRVQGYLCDQNSAPAADAVRNGEVFLGWYTDLTGGNRVTELNGDVSGMTLFARWESSESMEDPDTVSITVTVTGDVVNIRSGPGTNYGITKRSYRNDVLAVSHVTHLTNMKWGKVQDGWICLDYTNYDDVISGNTDEDHIDLPSEDETLPDLEETWEEDDTDTSPENPDPVFGIVNVNNYLIIRDGPDKTYPAVGFLFKDDIVEILDQETVGSTSWGRIEEGWVCMDYIITDRSAVDEPIEPDTEKEPQQDVTDSAGTAEVTSITGKITADALRIRSGAGTENPIVGFYYEDDTVEITEKMLVGSVYWGKTSRGWISMDYVAADASGSTPTQPDNKETKTILADCLRIRKDAGTDHKIVGFLYYGDTVSVYETKDVDGTLWGRVNTGWICMQYAA